MSCLFFKECFPRRTSRASRTSCKATAPALTAFGENAARRDEPLRHEDAKERDERINALHLAWSPLITTSRNSRARRANASTPSGLVGRGITGAKMFSQHNGIFRPVKATGSSSL